MAVTMRRDLFPEGIWMSIRDRRGYLTSLFAIIHIDRETKDRNKILRTSRWSLCSMKK
jgi:hypothetical protein